MELSQQVISLEYAKRLKELNVKQESLFYWCEYNSIVTNLHYCYERPDVKNEYSAFTTSELGEMLPRLVMKDDVGYFLEIYIDCDGNWCVVYKGFLDSKLTHEYSQSEANCRAMMLIYLIENGLVKV